MSAGPSPDSPAVRVLEELLARALAVRASDLHVESKLGRVAVRLRVDGVMVDDRTLPTDVGLLLINRIKVLASLDIAERRAPQDGMFTVPVERGAPLTLRVSTFPSLHGEKLVLRLLVLGRMLRLPALGLGPEQAGALQRMSRLQNGLVLVTGPTGAGKTSTLYALLHEVDTRRRNVVTLEDPIELELQGVTQGQLNRKAGMDFASGLRAILRQDPDVILVGEIRDVETARIAVQASLTGHLVLSTLHTNSVQATITRLVDMGLDAYIVAAALEGIVAQRLVRRLCVACRAPDDPARVEGLEGELGFPVADPAGFFMARGCAACLDTGYHGRVGLFEVVPVDDPLRGLIKQGVGVPVYKQHLAARGVPSLRRAGVEAAEAGLTSLDEVLRLT
jgi:general secretion pathway protein E